jgi:hypothetical protein
MNREDEETLRNLIDGGLLGAGLTALLKRQADGEDIALGALLGAAIVASFSASQKAKTTEIPVLVEDGNSLYWKYQDGRKEFYKALPDSLKFSLKKFKLS